MSRQPGLRRVPGKTTHVTSAGLSLSEEREAGDGVPSPATNDLVTENCTEAQCAPGWRPIGAPAGSITTLPDPRGAGSAALLWVPIRPHPVSLFTCISCSPLCTATFDLGKSSKLKCVLKGQKLSRLLVSKIDRAQTSFRALFGIKARKLKNFTFCKIASLSVQWCSGLVYDGGHFISNFQPKSPLMPTSKMESIFAPCSAFLVF